MNIEFSIPETAPQRGNPLIKWIANGIMRLSGLTLIGEFPTESKFVAVAAPHRTAILDFSIAVIVMYAMGVRFSFMIKHTVVRWPIGGPIRWLGGIPINRSAAHGVVSEVAAAFKAHEKLIIAVMPEGTRRKAGVPVTEWKRGFYHIAKRSDVPILPLYLSYTHRRVAFGKVLHVSDDMKADIAELQKFYDFHKSQE